MIKRNSQEGIRKKKKENYTGYRAGGVKQTGNRGRRQEEKRPHYLPLDPHFTLHLQGLNLRREFQNIPNFKF